MAEPKVLAEVRLGAHHEPTGIVRHYFGFADGSSVEVPRPVSLRIVQYDGDGSRAYLLYCDDQGDDMTDTLHDSFDEAVAHAEAEFGVRPDEWVDRR